MRGAARHLTCRRYAAVLFMRLPQPICLFGPENARTALVVGTEIYSRILDWSDRSTCVLFGDGAGAVVLTQSDSPESFPAICMLMAATAVYFLHPAVYAGARFKATPFVMMEGNTVFKFAIKVLEEVVQEALAENNLQVIRYRLADSASGQYPHYHFHRKKIGYTDGKGGRHSGQAGQYFGCLDSAGA